MNLFPGKYKITPPFKEDEAFTAVEVKAGQVTEVVITLPAKNHPDTKAVATQPDRGSDKQDKQDPPHSEK